MAISLNNLGNVAFDQGNPKKAFPLYKESLTISREIGSKKNIAFSLIQLGMIEVDLGNYASAQELIDQGLAISKELEHQQFIAYAYGCLGDLARKKMDAEQAYVRFGQSLLLWKELGNQNGVSQVLDGFAQLAIQEKQWQRVAHLLATADALREVINISRTPAKQRELRSVYAELDTQLDKEAMLLAQGVGRKMTVEQAISYALNQVAT